MVPPKQDAILPQHECGCLLKHPCQLGIIGKIPFKMDTSHSFTAFSFTTSGPGFEPPTAQQLVASSAAGISPRSPSGHLARTPLMPKGHAHFLRRSATARESNASTNRMILATDQMAVLGDFRLVSASLAQWLRISINQSIIPMRRRLFSPCVLCSHRSVGPTMGAGGVHHLHTPSSKSSPR